MHLIVLLFHLISCTDVSGDFRGEHCCLAEPFGKLCLDRNSTCSGVSTGTRRGLKFDPRAPSPLETCSVVAPENLLAKRLLLFFLNGLLSHKLVMQPLLDVKACST